MKTITTSIKINVREIRLVKDGKYGFYRNIFIPPQQLKTMAELAKKGKEIHVTTIQTEKGLAVNTVYDAPVTRNEPELPKDYNILRQWVLQGRDINDPSNPLMREIYLAIPFNSIWAKKINELAYCQKYIINVRNKKFKPATIDEILELTKNKEYEKSGNKIRDVLNDLRRAGRIRPCDWERLYKEASEEAAARYEREKLRGLEELRLVMKRLLYEKGVYQEFRETESVAYTTAHSLWYYVNYILETIACRAAYEFPKGNYRKYVAADNHICRVLEPFWNKFDSPQRFQAANAVAQKAVERFLNLFNGQKEIYYTVELDEAYYTTQSIPEYEECKKDTPEWAAWKERAARMKERIINKLKTF